jgi:hypothetical protein
MGDTKTFLNPEVKKYDDLSGDILLSETKRFLLAFPESIKCLGCNTAIKPENMCAINFHQLGSISFSCFNCGTSFTIFLMGKFIRHFCLTNQFTELTSMERV